jgi:hypothetical protein
VSKLGLGVGGDSSTLVHGVRGPAVDQRGGGGIASTAGGAVEGEELGVRKMRRRSPAEEMSRARRTTRSCVPPIAQPVMR